MDFDLIFSCENGVIKTKITNYNSVSSGASKYLTDQLSLLNHSFSIGCNLLIIEGAVNYCQKGLNKIDKWLDFRFYYGGSGDFGLSKACSRRMSLDAKGNLHLNANKAPNPGKAKNTKANKRKKNSLVLSRMKSKS